VSTPGDYEKIWEVKPLDGSEAIRNQGKPTGDTVRDLWRWSFSDLVSNATRGVVAEFIVAKALGCDMKIPRDEWQAYDLLTPEGARIQVKSAGYLQSWVQREYSSIVYSIKPTRAWNRESNRQEKASGRHADVYVFALLAHREKATLDPLELDQWRFHVLATATLASRTRSQHSITLKSLEKLSDEVRFEGLKDAVANCSGPSMIRRSHS